MTNMRDKMNCVVTVHVTGETIKRYDNPTRAQLIQIFNHLVYCIKSGKDIEGVVVQKNVKLI